MTETKIDYESQISRLKDQVDDLNDDKSVAEKKYNNLSLEHEKLKLAHDSMSSLITKTMKEAKYEQEALEMQLSDAKENYGMELSRLNDELEDQRDKYERELTERELQRTQDLQEKER